MGDASFSRAFRLTRTSDYQALYKEGRRVPSRNFLLFIRPSNTECSRIGISSGRKVGTAVARNRIRRRIREIARRYRSRFSFAADIVIVAHPSSTGLSFSEMEKEIVALMTKARLL